MSVSREVLGQVALALSEMTQQFVLAEQKTFVLAGKQLFGLPFGEKARLNHCDGDWLGVVGEATRALDSDSAKEFAQLDFVQEMAASDQVEEIVSRHSTLIAATLPPPLPGRKLTSK
jgi:hypothetical protein